MLKLVGGRAVVQRRLRERGFNAINVNRYDAQISLDMTGVREAVTDAQWTLELQRRLIAEVTPTDLRGRACALHERSARHCDAG